MPSYATTVEVPVTVEYAYHEPSKGHRDSHGAPDEPATIEITAVFAGKVNIIDTLAGTTQIEELEEIIMEEHANERP